MFKNKKKIYMGKFLDTLKDFDEYFFSTNNLNDDWDIVNSTLQFQGYWAGSSLRFYFDEEFNLVKTEERIFGK